MGRLIGRLIINALALWIVSQIITGFTIEGWKALILGTVVLAIVNTFLKPFFLFLSFPLNIVTLGLFTLVVNAVILEIVAFLVKGFSLANFWPTAILAAVLLAIVSTLLGLFVKKPD